MNEGQAMTGVEAASADDAAWFDANPDRIFRLRDRMAGEYETLDMGLLPPPGMAARTLVVQMQPGVRGRQPIAIDAHIANDDATDTQLFAFFKRNYAPEAQDMVRKLRSVTLPAKPKPTS